MFQGEQFYYNHTLQVPNGNEIFEGFDFDDQDIHRDAIGNYSNKLYKDRVIDILDDHNQNNPFFIYTAFQTVHEPIEIAPKTYATCDNVVP